MKKYLAIWHQENQVGNVEYMMGCDGPFDTHEEAEEAIRKMIAEDRASCEGQGLSFRVITNYGEITCRTESADEHCCYKVVEIEEGKEKC